MATEALGMLLSSLGWHWFASEVGTVRGKEPEKPTRQLCIAQGTTQDQAHSSLRGNTEGSNSLQLWVEEETQLAAARCARPASLMAQ